MQSNSVTPVVFIPPDIDLGNVRSDWTAFRSNPDNAADETRGHDAFYQRYLLQETSTDPEADSKMQITYFSEHARQSPAKPVYALENFSNDFQDIHRKDSTQ